MRINHNLPSLRAFNALGMNNVTLTQVMQRLSTGLRINSPADDPSGFAVSERMRTELTTLSARSEIIRDKLSLLETAEGGLSQENAILQRIRELAVQAANPTLTFQDRLCIQDEIDQLKAQLDNVANNTEFNGKKLLDGSMYGRWSCSDPNVEVRLNSPVGDAAGEYRIEYEYTELPTLQTLTTAVFPLTVEEDTTYTEYVPILEGSVEDKPSTGLSINIVLENVNIDVSAIDGGCAFSMDDSQVKVYLSGTNTLASGVHRAALEAPQGSDLTISSVAGDGQTSGTLIARGGPHGSGIGGCCNIYPPEKSSGGNVTILGGTIHAWGGSNGAGIGGGQRRDAANVSILFGNVYAHGGANAAGIGSSFDVGAESSSVITIAGGNVEAWGGVNASGIGGGRNSAAGTISIKDGLVGKTIIAHGGAGGQTIGSGSGYSGTYTGFEDARRIVIPGVEYRAVEVLDKTTRPATLRDIPAFYEGGKFLLPQTITLMQGGKRAQVTLTGSDTVRGMAEKLNLAIGEGLGQGVKAGMTQFCTMEAEEPEAIMKASYMRDEYGNLILRDGEAVVRGVERAEVVSERVSLVMRSVISGCGGGLVLGCEECMESALGAVRAGGDAGKMRVRVYEGMRIVSEGSVAGGVVRLMRPDVEVRGIGYGGLFVSSRAGGVREYI